VRRCVVRRLVHRLISRLISVFVWFLLKDQLQSIIDSINDLTLQIRKHEYFGDLEYIILIVGILSLYAINLGYVSLFIDSLFMFLTILKKLLYLIYPQIELMNIVLFL